MLGDEPRLYFVANQDIRPGTELLYDYGERRKNVVGKEKADNITTLCCASAEGFLMNLTLIYIRKKMCCTPHPTLLFPTITKALSPIPRRRNRQTRMINKSHQEGKYKKHRVG